MNGGMEMRTEGILLTTVLFLMAAPSARAGQYAIDVPAAALVSVEGTAGRSWQRFQVEFPAQASTVRIDGAFLDVRVSAASLPDARSAIVPIVEIAEYSEAEGEGTTFVAVDKVVSRLPVRAGTTRVVRLDVTPLVRSATARGALSVDLVLGAITEGATGSFAIDTLDESGCKARMSIIYQPRFGSRASERCPE